MKVGIMTFHRAINYGAVLQSLALKETIKDLGNECEIINYKCDELEKVASPFYIQSLKPKDIAVFLLQIRMRLIKNKKFNDFAVKYLDKSKPVLTPKNIGSISSEYDAFVTGSDQVWNYEITGLDENYFLSFADKSKRRISYAASFGVSTIPSQYREQYKRLLGQIDCISVREEQGAAMVKELLQIQSKVCVDPVFLFGKEQWKQYITMEKPKDDYIVVYCINKSECYEIAEQLSEQTGLKVVGLQVPMSNRSKCMRIQTESPEDFLGWLYYAKYVVTDSFHGTAFSVIFNKQFLVCTGGSTKGRSSRQENLLNMLGLSSRMSSDNKYLTIMDTIDYTKVNGILESVAEESKAFLRNSLKEKE